MLPNLYNKNGRIPNCNLNRYAYTDSKTNFNINSFTYTNFIPNHHIHPYVTPTPTEDLSFYNLASCIPQNTLVQNGTVTEVIDGDTIYVRLEDGNTYSVRYIGTDSPESGRPFYIESSKANSDLVLNKDVILVKDASETDQYDRLLRYVIVQNKFVNLEMVRLGYAVAETYPPDVSCSDIFSSAQNEAQANLFGIWASTPTPESSAAQVIIVTVDKRDEYVDIKNVGNSDVDLAGWNLVSEKGNQDCPLSGILGAGQTLRIWSMNSQGGGYYCGYNSPIWNNSDPDPAVLYNAQRVEVSRW